MRPGRPTDEAAAFGCADLFGTLGAQKPFTTACLKIIAQGSMDHRLSRERAERDQLTARAEQIVGGIPPT